MASAIDLSSSITADKIPALKAAGIKTIIRYLSAHPKGITKAEYDLLFNNGFGIVLVYEAAGNLYSSFTQQNAHLDLQEILRLLTILGAPNDCAVYVCACDFDASLAQISNDIASYFSVLKAGFGKHRLGSYGNGAANQYLLAEGLVSLTWVWGAASTNGTIEFIQSGKWNIRQHPTISEFGLSIDPDDTQGDFGAIFLSSASSASAPNSPLPPIVQFPIPPVLTMQQALVALRLLSNTDGIWGPKSADALMTYYSTASQLGRNSK